MGTRSKTAENAISPGYEDEAFIRPLCEPIDSRADLGYGWLFARGLARRRHDRLLLRHEHRREEGLAKSRGKSGASRSHWRVETRR